MSGFFRTHFVTTRQMSFNRTIEELKYLANERQYVDCQSRPAF